MRVVAALLALTLSSCTYSHQVGWYESTKEAKFQQLVTKLENSKHKDVDELVSRALQLRYASNLTFSDTIRRNSMFLRDEALDLLHEADLLEQLHESGR